MQLSQSSRPALEKKKRQQMANVKENGQSKKREKKTRQTPAMLK